MTERWDEYEEIPGVPSPEILEPEPVDRLLDRTVGQQISRLIEFGLGDNPRGGATVGFELRNHERPFYWVFPIPRELQAKFGMIAAFVPQLLPAQNIITARMDRRLSLDRRDAEMTWNPLYRAVEGEWIRGARFEEEPNDFGGQRITFELTGGLTFQLDALPGSAHGLLSRYTANYRMRLRRQRKLISLPG